MSFKSIDRGTRPYISTLQQHCIAPDKLVLKKGAQVMLVKNKQTRQLVNGSRGTVIDFTSIDSWSDRTYDADGPVCPIVKFTNGEAIVVRPETWEVCDVCIHIL